MKSATAGWAPGAWVVLGAVVSVAGALAPTNNYPPNLRNDTEIFGFYDLDKPDQVPVEEKPKRRGRPKKK